jgi:endoglucanase
MRLRTTHGLLILFLLALCPAGGCKQGSWPLWNAYQAHFIDNQGRVIDHTSGGRTTSEGQAYAMFFALADDDHPEFDRLFRWTTVNMASGDLATHLPGWLWGQGKDGQWKLQDQNPAADADVWMAYTLVEAGRLWNVPAYSSTGRAMMAMIAKSEVLNMPGFGPMLMPGPTGFQHNQTWTLNPSYMPLFLFQRLAKVDPSGPWQQIALATGNKDSDVPGGSYDAIRVYLWAGMISGSGTIRAQVLSAIPAMSVYLANHDAPPEKVSEQGIPLAQDGPVGFSAAVLPYLRAFPDLSRLSAQQTIRMSKMRDASTGLYGKDLAYYDQNLALFSTGFLDGRFRFGPGGELTVQWER